MAKVLILEEAQSREITISEKITTIGRDPNASILIQEKRASKLHCQIVQEAEQFYIVDLASSNGTQLNGKKITRSLLTHEDEISIGKTKLIFSQNSLTENAFDVPILKVPALVSSPTPLLKEVFSSEQTHKIPKKSPKKRKEERKYLFWIGLAFLFVFGMWWLSPNSSAVEERTSLLANFSFEEENRQLPEHWSFTGSLQAQVTLDPIDAPHGLLSLKIETQEGKNDSYFMARSEAVPIKEFQPYQVFFRTQFEHGISAGLWLTYTSEKKHVPNWDEYHLFTPKKDWQSVSFSSIAPEGMTHLVVGLVVYGPKAFIHFDQVELKTGLSKETFPKIYHGDSFSVLVFSKGRWELRWKEKVLFSQAQWWIQSSETRFSQVQMNITDWSHSVRRFDLSGELFDFTNQKKFPFHFSLQNTSTHLLLEYTLDPSWLNTPYLPYFQGVLASDATLIIQNEVQTGNFLVPETQQFQFQGDSTEDLLMECAPPLRIQGERDLEKVRDVLVLYPKEPYLSLKITRQRKEKKDITFDWITANSQYQKGYFGKAYTAFQKVLPLLSKDSSRYQEAQEKMQQIDKKCKEVLKEVENALLLFQANPSEVEQKKIVQKIQELLLRFSPLPIEKKLSLYLTQTQQTSLHSSSIAETNESDPLAEKLFQLGQKAYQAEEFFKAKVYWNALLKDYDPKQHWRKKLQTDLLELDRNIAQKLQENK